MELLGNLAGGFAGAVTPVNLFYCFIGVAFGTFVGVLPGIGSMVGITVLLPLTFYLDPAAALIMLAGIYYGGEYGGSIASILINMPGSASTAVTCIDGNQMTKNGRAGVALSATAIASFVGGSIGIVLLTLFSPLLAAFSLRFGPADYFAVMAFGLIASTTIGDGSAIKKVGAVILGILLGTVGTDVNTGIQRFTFGELNLYDGISLVILAMGLFGIAEVMSSAASNNHADVRQKVRLRDMIPTRQDVRDGAMPTARGSLLGSALGALPGTGPTIAAFMAYMTEKQISRHPERFGTGTIEGVVGPESANNAAAQTAFIPTLTLGIPGSATMALILGALMIHGIPPGPKLMTEHADLFWVMVASFWIGNLMLLVLNIPMVGIWVRLLSIPYRLLFPCIVGLVCVGVYSVKLSAFDVGLVLAIGIAGYGMRLTRISAAPLLMGFILGPLMEEHLRRAMLLSRGELSVFIHEPISATVLLAAGLLLAWTGWSAFRQRRLSQNF
ncbi:tripartite tricarboxylate transporter permease [Pelagibacterium halotolerans]|uniref:Tricarboxylate transport membrane protein TctA n=1 Tax=Pelagibacterium halotolerans (strain DSM 22347 / JCM 15775 / CGMCC 1.7692 / B2) TaxID=1082931 RepID=G4R741_PELHB|nr:tripartite tricarboxylate transporter permease [Pelagibacterium halotolerans]AEQ50195.1 tricarboxylate transport membrane protein TctA [Pelagibacterium halotolerans B2]QJR19801.1 tripartite tricarboxylate transporter permease [Pelagibacterium halotolerans]SEA50358.1 TctA family transporter [Pelagibacterium halotolerans]